MKSARSKPPATSMSETKPKRPPIATRSVLVDTRVCQSEEFLRAAMIAGEADFAVYKQSSWGLNLQDE